MPWVFLLYLVWLLVADRLLKEGVSSRLITAALAVLLLLAAAVVGSSLHLGGIPIGLLAYFWIPVLLGGCWGVGVAYHGVVRVLGLFWYLRLIARNGGEDTSPDYQGIVEELRARMGIGREVKCVASREFESFAATRSTILVPAASLLSESELRAVLGHELAHIRNRDYLWVALLIVVEVVFFFCPEIKTLRTRIDSRVESARDGEVVGLGINPLDLATPIQTLARRPELNQEGKAPDRVMRLLRPDSQQPAASTRLINPKLGGALLLALLLLLVPRHQVIQVISPIPGDEVPHRVEVKLEVRPPLKPDQEARLFLLARDGWFWSQATRILGQDRARTELRSVATLGWGDNDDGKSYTLAPVIVPEGELKGIVKLKALDRPGWIRGERVSVALKYGSRKTPP